MIGIRARDGVKTARSGFSGRGSGPPPGELRAWGPHVDSGATCTPEATVPSRGWPGRRHDCRPSRAFYLNSTRGQAALAWSCRTVTGAPTLCPCKGDPASLSLSVRIHNMGIREKTQGKPTRVSTEEPRRGTPRQCTRRMLSWGGVGLPPQPRDPVAVAEGGGWGAGPW